MAKAPAEKRRHVRIGVPLSVRVISPGGGVESAESKNVSPLGIRFESKKNGLNVNDEIELAIKIPGALSSVHTKAKIVWKKKLPASESLSDIGCEFTNIEEDNKNTFLKYLCGLMYDQKKPEGSEGKEK